MGASTSKEDLRPYSERKFPDLVQIDLENQTADDYRFLDQRARQLENVSRLPPASEREREARVAEAEEIDRESGRLLRKTRDIIGPSRVQSHPCETRLLDLPPDVRETIRANKLDYENKTGQPRVVHTPDARDDCFRGLKPDQPSTSISSGNEFNIILGIGAVVVVGALIYVIVTMSKKEEQDKVKK